MRLRLSAAAAVAVLLAIPARAQEEPLEYAVKAAFLYNFARFVEWPQANAAGQPIVIGIVGQDPFGAVLDRAITGKSAGGRPLAVRRFGRIGEIGACSILFVAAGEVPRLDQILAQLRDAPTLVVGETDGFARRGGAIGFFVEARKVRFEINPGAAERTGLRLSARLLRLAQIVPRTAEER